MSEKEKQCADRILDTLNKLSEAKGSEYTEGLIAGINIGTVTSSMDAPENSRDIHGV